MCKIEIKISFMENCNHVDSIKKNSIHKKARSISLFVIWTCSKRKRTSQNH